MDAIPIIRLIQSVLFLAFAIILPLYTGQESGSSLSSCSAESSSSGGLLPNKSSDCLSCQCPAGQPASTCLCCPLGSFRCPASYFGEYCCDIGTSCAGFSRCAVLTITEAIPANRVTCVNDTALGYNTFRIDCIFRSVYDPSMLPTGLHCSLTSSISYDQQFIAANNLAVGQNLTITVDNFLLALYFDGVQVPDSLIINGKDNQWKVPDVVPLPTNVTVIALQAKNQETYGSAGILASDSLGNILTNTTWKCVASVSSNQWMMPSYPDAAWPPAHVSGPNSPGTYPWVNIPSINPKAQWMWTTVMPTSDQVIYCRLTLK